VKVPKRARRDRGASLVEFAMMMPFLILLLLGIIEFAWVFSENLDVRQGAREGARLTAVDLPPGNLALGGEICSRMDLVGGDATVTWVGDPTQIGDAGTMEAGDGVTVTVTSPRTSLTGLLEWAFPAGFTALVSTVEIRVEQPPTWGNGVYDCATMTFT
jgi:Flp pilus assembly protein TadG